MPAICLQKLLNRCTSLSGAIFAIGISGGQDGSSEQRGERPFELPERGGLCAFQRPAIASSVHAAYHGGALAPYGLR